MQARPRRRAGCRDLQQQHAAALFELMRMLNGLVDRHVEPADAERAAAEALSMLLGDSADHVEGQRRRDGEAKPLRERQDRGRDADDAPLDIH